MPPTELNEIPLATFAAAAPAAVATDLFLDPPENLLSDDGEPLETGWHVTQFLLLIELIQQHRAARRDFYVGGNMFVYYSREQARNRDYRGPDFFLVNNVAPKPERLYWAIWDEGGRFPDLIVELMSPTTRENDLTTKFEIYERIFTTPEYVAYDPETCTIHAWRKHADGLFHPIEPDSAGRYFLETANLSIGTWFGKRYQFETTWLRFFDVDGRVVPSSPEASAAAIAQAANAIALANEVKALADEQKARADEQKARADGLAAELARLKAQLANPS